MCISWPPFARQMHQSVTLYHTIVTVEPRDVPRMGVKDKWFNDLLDVTQRPSSVESADIAVALHMSFNRMQEICPTSRDFLQEKTVRDAKAIWKNEKKIYQKYSILAFGHSRS
jgi:hypothetical protein